MVEINWTDEAKFWLRSVFDYISEDNPDAALNVVTGIYDKTQLLSDHPRLGQRYDRIVDREIREIIYGHYRIPYLIVSQIQIDIPGVFHGAMDIEKYLK